MADSGPITELETEAQVGNDIPQGHMMGRSQTRALPTAGCCVQVPQGCGGCQQGPPHPEVAWPRMKSSR